MRTTIDIAKPILEEAKRLAADEGKTLGQAITDLLAEALSRRSSRRGATPEFAWNSQPMGAPFDYADKDAVWEALEGRGSFAVREKRRR